MGHNDTQTLNILENDDFLTGANTSIALVTGNHSGTVSFDPLVGTMTYTPGSDER